MSFIGIGQIFSSKAARSLKSSAFVSYTMYVVPVNISKKCITCLIQSGHRLVAVLPVETGSIESLRNAVIGGPMESVYGLSTSQVFDVR